MTDRVYIVAGNYEEFRQYKNNKFKEYESYWLKKTHPSVTPAENFTNYVFVQHIGQLRGLDEIKGFYIGTYDKRDDIDEIKQEISFIKTRQASFYRVYLNGVVVPLKDYSISETFGILDEIGKKTTHVVLSFFQAPPAGSHLVIENKDGIVISRNVPDNPNSIFDSFSYEFPEVTPWHT